MIKSLLDADENPPPGTKVIIEDTTVETPTATIGSEETQNAENVSETPIDETFAEQSKPKNIEPPLFQTDYKPESQAETIRNSGLAYSAAITLFASVVFMLIIGWFADLLLGSSPWGIVGGIVLGSLIGFFQFFRTTSQILKNKD